MISLSTSLYPALNLGDIKLGKKNINVKAFFTMEENRISPFVASNHKLLAYSNVYFFLSTQLSNSVNDLPPSILKNASTRVQNVAGYYKRNKYSAIRWYDYLSKKYPSTVISLDKILKTEKNITDSELSDIKSVKDINFEANIPINESLYKKSHILNVNLYAFVHMDTAAMIDAGEISSISTKAARCLKVGSSCRIKKILQRNGKILEVPTTKTILVTPEGKAYNGSYFVSGKTRFYAVSDGGISKTLLRKIQTRETSITAEHLIDEYASSPLNHMPVDNGHLNYSYSKPFVDTSQIETSEVDDPEFYNMSYASQINKSRTLHKIKDNNTNYITNAYHYIDSSGTASNSIYFDLEWEKIVKHKTEFGHLIEAAKKRKEILQTLNLSSLSNFNLSSETLLSKVKITEMTVKRVRIKNDQASIKSIGASSYEVDYQDEKILSKIKNFQNSSAYQDSNINFYINKKKSTYYKKCMVLNDYETYREPREGMYCYTLELLLEDRTSEYFNNLLSIFRNNLIQYDLLLQEIKTKNAHIPEKDKFKQSVITSTYNVNLQSIIDTYILMLCWLGKDISNQKMISLKNNLETSVLPTHGGTVSGAEKFKFLCDTIVHDMQKVINQSSITPMDNAIKGKTLARNVSGKISPFQKHVFKIPGKTKSIESGKIMLSFSRDITDDSVEVSSNGKISLKPGSYLYRNNGKTFVLLSESQLKTTIGTEYGEDKSRSLLLDNAIKSSMDAKIINTKLKTKEHSLSLDMVFGIPGVSISVPSTTGVSETESNKVTPDIVQAAENQSGLSVALEQAAADSTRKLSGKNLLVQQQNLQIEKLRVAKKRGLILEKTIDVLSSIKNLGPRTINGSIRVPKIIRDRSPKDILFKNRAGVIKVAVSGNSPEMNFVELTREMLSRVKGNTATVKIEQPSSKVDGENYVVVDDIFEISKKALQDFLKRRV